MVFNLNPYPPFPSDHIASCCLLVDCNINVWDIRRPFIPFAQFGKHNDVARGIEWKKRDPRSLLSCGKDNLLIQVNFMCRRLFDVPKW